MVTAMATYQITPPEHFNFGAPEGWTGWIKQFERFRNAGGLKKNPESEQVDSLVFIMGPKAEEIFASFTWAEDGDDKKYEKVKKKFTDHFIVKRNLIFESARFNSRVQQEGETAEEFITQLYTLSENLDYGDLRNRMIRDRLVVGLRDKGLSEKLQLNADLTLETAITKVRQSESVKNQQGLLVKSTTEAVQVKPSGDEVIVIDSVYDSAKNCPDCRRKHRSQNKCPAQGKQCYNCNQWNHFAYCCPNPSKHKGQGYRG